MSSPPAVHSRISPHPCPPTCSGSVLLTRGLAQALPFTLACLILGVVGDATLVQLGLLSFEPYPSLFGAPLWMVALWLNFGLMLRPLFTWFLDHCWRAIIGFSAGGVVAYYSGQKLECLPSALTSNPNLGWPWSGLLPDSSYATYISNFHYPNEYA